MRLTSRTARGKSRYSPIFSFREIFLQNHGPNDERHRAHDRDSGQPKPNEPRAAFQPALFHLIRH